MRRARFLGVDNRITEEILFSVMRLSLLRQYKAYHFHFGISSSQHQEGFVSERVLPPFPSFLLSLLCYFSTPRRFQFLSYFPFFPFSARCPLKNPPVAPRPRGGNLVRARKQHPFSFHRAGASKRDSHAFSLLIVAKTDGHVGIKDNRITEEILFSVIGFNWVASEEETERKMLIIPRT